MCNRSVSRRSRHAPRRRALVRLVAAMLLLPFAVTAQNARPSPSADELLSAIVGVRSEVPDDARTAEALGTQRIGSGVVIDGNGLVATIGYLIMEAHRVEVLSGPNRSVEARVLAYDHDTGFGLLRTVEPLEVTPMRLGSSDALATGDRLLVAAHGGPAAARAVVLVSRRDFAGYWEYLLENAIFTSPPYPLFGGAALLNADGELVGIGSLVVSDALSGSRTLPGNMFIPVDRLKAVLADLLTLGRSSASARPWLGIYLSEVDGLLVVQRLAPEGPAAAAGLHAGDIVIGVAGQPVESMADFYRKLWAAGEPGDRVVLTILEGANMTEVDVTAGDRYQWLRLGPP